RSASAAAPGPGPLSESLLRQLELGVARRMESLLPGDHRSALLGSGTELAQVRPYRPGEDDVRLIDWNVTARMAEPHVRVQLAERLLVTWVLLDVSPSMGFGTADRRKADVAEGAALALAYAATRRGNRLGVVTFGDGDVRALPPRQGRAGMLSLLLALRRQDEGRAAGPTSLGQVLGRTARLARQHALVAIVSDFRGPRDWRAALLDVLGRHDVIAVEVRDPREQELPRLGELWLVDPETGRQLRVDTSSARLRERFASAAAEERASLARTLAAAGVAHVVVSTSGDWLRTLAGFLRRRGERR